MSQTRVSSSTGELIKRKYIYLTMPMWYKLEEISRKQSMSESEMIQFLIRAHTGLPTERDSNEKEIFYQSR